MTLSRAENVVGQTFGLLTVQYLLSLVAGVPRKCVCLCACGKTKETRVSALREGTSTSCGCATHARRSEQMRFRHRNNRVSKGLSAEPRRPVPRPRAVETIGQTFGRLTVLRLLPPTKTRTPRRCECSCACDPEKRVNVRVSALRYGTTTSCGCRQREEAGQRFRKFNEQRQAGQMIVPGQVFGSLSVVGVSSVRREGKACWDCRCACGRVRPFTSYKLESGGAKSCGDRHCRTTLAAVRKAAGEETPPPRHLPAPLLDTHHGEQNADSLCKRAWIGEFGSKGTLDRALVTCPGCLRKLPKALDETTARPAAPASSPLAPVPVLVVEPPAAPIEPPAPAAPAPRPARPPAPAKARTDASALAAQMLPIVRGMAQALARRLPSSITVDDLISAGNMGLADAIARFDPTHEGGFEPYAKSRIRGAMLDELRAADPLSRIGRGHAKQISAATRTLEARLGRAPTADEIAAELNIPLDVYWQRAGDTAASETVSLDDEAHGPVQVAKVGDGADQALSDHEKMREVQRAVSTLPDRARAVVDLRYTEGLKLREIGERLGLSESRVCQIETKALQTLREGAAAPLSPTAPCPVAPGTTGQGAGGETFPDPGENDGSERYLVLSALRSTVSRGAAAAFCKMDRATFNRRAVWYLAGNTVPLRRGGRTLGEKAVRRTTTPRPSPAPAPMVILPEPPIPPAPPVELKTDGGRALDAADLEALAESVPEAEASPWDPGEDEEEDVEVPEESAAAAEAREDEADSKLPDVVPFKVSDAAQRQLNARTLDARERARMASGFYIGQAAGEVLDEDGQDEEGYGEEVEDDEEDADDGPEGGDEAGGGGRTVGMVELRRLNVLQGTEVTEQPGVDYQRPKTRADCIGEERPCPFVSCQWHLYLDMGRKNGALKFNFPDIEVWEMKHSCALDVADRGGATLIEVGRMLNVTRERIRQMETKASARIRRSFSGRQALTEFVDESAPLVVQKMPPLVIHRKVRWDPAPAFPRPSSRQGVIDILGKVFGLLTVRGRAKPDPRYHGHAMWTCDCACGQSRIVSGVRLRQGLSTSCGCEPQQAEEAPTPPPSPAPPPVPVVDRRRAEDITDRTFGMLTVVSRSPQPNGARRAVPWLCRCTCGGTRVVPGVDLLGGRKITDCGCVKRKARAIAEEEQAEKRRERKAAMAPGTTAEVSTSRPIVASTILFDIPAVQASIRRLHPGVEHVERVTESALFMLSANLRTVVYVLHHEGLQFGDAALRFNVEPTFLRKIEMRAMIRLGVKLA